MAWPGQFSSGTQCFWESFKECHWDVTLSLFFSPSGQRTNGTLESHKSSAVPLRSSTPNTQLCQLPNRTSVASDRPTKDASFPKKAQENTQEQLGFRVPANQTNMFFIKTIKAV